ncbi:MAG: heme ABC transporter permease CcmC [Pseudomonadota bacterium]
MWTFFHKLGSPPHFYRLSLLFSPWLAIPGYLLIAWGTYTGLFVAPEDYQQRDAFRIIYIHVPAAYLAQMTYAIMAVAGAIGLIWRMKLAHAVAAAAAPIGASFCILMLVTGSIWGRPMWGTWWEWGDPRLMSALILLFLYFGLIAMRNAISDTAKADKACAVLAMVGALNIPIIRFSVDWWTSLHQGATLIRRGGPAMDADMLWPLLANLLGFSLVLGAVLLRRIRTEVLYRERRKRWVRDLVLGSEAA